MEDYLWLWLSASSFINGKSPYFQAVVEKILHTVDSSAKPQNDNNPQNYWIRRTNTPYFPKYIWNEKLPELAIQLMSKEDYLIESFFLSLRTDRWINNISDFEPVVVADYAEKIKLYEENWFIKLRENGFVLTDEWMDCYNGIITELLKEI